MKKLLLVFSVIITLSHAQIDWRVRQWVMNYVKSDDSTIDTTAISYADSMFIKKLISDWADLDTINCDTIYISGGGYTVRLTLDSLDAQHGVFDVHILSDSIDVQHAAIDVHITTDSIDAQHIVADKHIQTDSIATAHAVITQMDADMLVDDVDITGIENTETDSLTVNTDATITGNTITDSLDAQHVVADVHAKIESLDVKKETVDTLIYATTVDKAVQIAVSVPHLGTGAPPGAGTEDQFKTLDFNKTNDEDVFFQLDLPSDYKAAGAIDIEVCFFVDGTVIGDTFVVWGCEYKTITHDNAEVFDFDAGTAIKLDTMTLSSGDAAKLYRESTISLVTTGFVVSDLLLCRIFRDADNAKDDYDGDARTVHFEMLYESDKPGRYN